MSNGHHRNGLQSLLATTLLTLLLIVQAQAYRVSFLSLEEVRNQADRVIIGTVTGVTLRTDGPATWRDYQVTVEETLLGAPSHQQTLPFAANVAGVPVLERGTRYVLFLDIKKERAVVPTVGANYGIFRFVQALPGSKTDYVLVSDLGQPLEINTAGNLQLGHSVTIREGKVVPAQKHDSPEPLAVKAYNADGSPAQVLQEVSKPEIPLTERPWATLEDLRRFLKDKK